MGGGWIYSDQSVTPFSYQLDSYFTGLKFLRETFSAPPPTIAWSIDTFGYANWTPDLLSKLGFEAVYITRIGNMNKERILGTENTPYFVWEGNGGGKMLALLS